MIIFKLGHFSNAYSVWRFDLHTVRIQLKSNAIFKYYITCLFKIVSASASIKKLMWPMKFLPTKRITQNSYCALAWTCWKSNRWNDPNLKLSEPQHDATNRIFDVIVSHNNKNIVYDSSSGYVFRKYLKPKQIFYLYLSSIPIIPPYLYINISIR